MSEKNLCDLESQLAALYLSKGFSKTTKRHFGEVAWKVICKAAPLSLGERAALRQRLRDIAAKRSPNSSKHKALAILIADLEDKSPRRSLVAADHDSDDHENFVFSHEEISSHRNCFGPDHVGGGDCCSDFDLH